MPTLNPTWRAAVTERAARQTALVAAGDKFDVPDCSERWSMPGSGMEEHVFDTRDIAASYFERQCALAILRDDKIVGGVEEQMLFETGKVKPFPTGRWKVKMWYGPYHVWVCSNDYEGLAEAEYKDGDNYVVRTEYSRILTVPIASTTRIKDFIAQLKAAHKPIPRQLSRRNFFL